MIGPISFQYGPLGNYTAGNVSMVNPVSAVDKVANINPVGSDNISVSETRPAECQTCKGRKYVDASNDEIGRAHV